MSNEIALPIFLLPIDNEVEMVGMKALVNGRRGTPILLGVVCFSGLALLLGVLGVFTPSPLIEDEITELSMIQQKQLEMYVEMTKLLITLGTFLFGAIGAMFAHFYEKDAAPRPQIWLALLAIVLAGGSIFCGYFSYQRVIDMFQAGFFNLSNVRVARSSHLQFYLFLASALVATWFGYRALGKEDSK